MRNHCIWDSGHLEEGMHSDLLGTMMMISRIHHRRVADLGNLEWHQANSVCRTLQGVVTSYQRFKIRPSRVLIKNMSHFSLYV
jgi:hypothetical protein